MQPTTRAPAQKPGEAPPKRTSSYTRFKSPVRREQGFDSPSTLPPPPFESEADATEIAWWLEQHMNLAANILCLEQMADAIPRAHATEATELRAVVADVETLRDALYELYCDAADSRLAALCAPTGSLSVYVRSLYAWCEALLDATVIVATGLKSGKSERSLVRDAVRECAQQIDRDAAARVASDVAALGLDAASPVEPLRNLPKDVQGLVDASASLEAAATRFFG